MPDPVAKIWMSTESPRTAYFDFSEQPEIEAGETLSSVVSGPTASPTGPTFGTATISGSQVAAKVEGTLTSGVTYTMQVTVLTSGGNRLTCAGYLQVESP